MQWPPPAPGHIHGAAVSLGTAAFISPDGLSGQSFEAMHWRLVQGIRHPVHQPVGRTALWS